MQGVGHNVQIQDYAFVILKSIQTKISICFDPIIYPLGSHQLAGRLVCLQLHMDSWCVPSGVAKGAFKHRVSHFRNVPWHHAMYSFHLDTSPSLSVVCRKTSECLDNLWVDSQASSTLIGQVFSLCQHMLDAFKLMPCSTYFLPASIPWPSSRSCCTLGGLQVPLAVGDRVYLTQQVCRWSSCIHCRPTIWLKLVM